MEIEIDTKNNRVKVFNIGIKGESGNWNHTGLAGQIGGSSKKENPQLIKDTRRYDMSRDGKTRQREMQKKEMKK